MRRRTRVIACVLALMLLLPAGATAAGAGEDAFARTWARTDQPVASGEVARTWVWGPQSFAAETEEYAESPSGTRAVRYFDKSRMEVTHPDAVDDGLWYVTNGLLVVELITGRMQIGDDAFVQRLPAEINVAGDQGFENGPTYATFRPLADRSEYQQKPGDRGAALVVERIDAAGLVRTDDTLAGQGVRLAFYDDITGHNIAAPFWEFMNADGLVEAGGELAVERLFVNPYYAAGRPITEPYWSDVVVAGTKQLVLLQCFERRCLTYTPGNEPDWRVEAGNVGRHYHQWRYAEVPEVAGQLIFYRTQYDPEAGQSTTDIYTINADGTDERNLTAEFGLNARLARWSPDGRQIAFWAASGASVERYSSDLYIVDADGDNLRQVTSVGEGIDWSPDGSQIVFTRPIAPFNTQLFVINVDGTGERQLTDIPPEEQPIGYPTSNSCCADWSPDGSRITFANQNRDVPGTWRSGVYVINVDGSGLTELAPQERAYTQPEWSPDGSTILFYRPQTAGREVWGGSIYTVDVAAGPSSIVELAGADATFPGPPAWSPDGTSVAVSLTPSIVSEGHAPTQGTRGIHLIDPDTRARIQITHYGADPAWSPDGAYLALTLDSEGWWAIDPSLVIATDVAGQAQWIVTSDGWGAQWRPGSTGT